MPSGGARNRSGPQPDPTSGRSEARGLSFTALPSEGCELEPPPWPMSPARDEQQAELELERWAQVWKSPQALVWHAQQWRWLAVAHYVRMAVVVECGGTASEVTAMLRLGDQIGLSPAGLKENGWQIAQDKLAVKRAEKAEEDEGDLRDRFTVVPDGTDG